MANVFASNLGEYGTFADIFGGGGGGASLEAGYSNFWSNGNGKNLLINNNALTAYVIIPANAEYFGHILHVASGTTTVCLVELWEGTTVHIQITHNDDNTISVKRGNAGTVLATSTTTYLRGTVVDVQVHAIINDTTGVVQVKINGNTGYDIDFAGDTRNAGTSGVIDRFAFRQIANFCRWTDFIWNDTSGSFETSWPGMVRMALGTMGANGSSGVQFTPSAGSNYQNIDDAVPGIHDGDGTYNEDTVAGHIDWFTPVSSIFTGMTLQTIKFVRTKYNARSTDAGAHTTRSKTKSGGNTANGATVSLSSSYAQKEDIFYVDPATSAAWATFAAITGAEFAYEMVS